MEKEVEVITIDNKDYAVIEEVNHNDNTFLYLANVIDEEDTLIRKVDQNDEDTVLPLKDDKEFELACNLLFKELAK